MSTPTAGLFRQRVVARSVEASGGTEYAELRIGEASLNARGTIAIGTGPEV